MTIETTTTLAPEEALALARKFFAGSGGPSSASISEQSEMHVVFATFRSRIAVSAFPDPQREGQTRVRASTLREEEAARKFITYVRTAESPTPEARRRSARERADS